MSQAFILLGDKTSHGGTVISATPQSTVDGRGIARKGDMVACPRCKGVFPIVEGDHSLPVDGAPVAYHGCKTKCGATLLSSLQDTRTDPSGGAAPNARSAESPSAVTPPFGVIGTGLAAGFEQEVVDQAQRYRGRFKVISEATGEPMPGLSMHVRASDGQTLTGETDAEGYTPWLEADQAETLSFDLADKTSP